MSPAARDAHGPPLVLAPGWLCDREVFAPQIAACGLEGALIAEHRRDGDLGAMAARLLAQAPPRFAVVGFSLGGMLAAELAALAPERLLGIAMLSSEAEAAPAKELAWRRRLTAEIRAEGEPALGRFAEWLGGRFFGHRENVAARLAAPWREMSARTDLEVFLRQSDALAARRDRLAAIGAYAAGGGSVLIVSGRLDRLCPVEKQRALKAAAPEAPLILIEDCGHLALWEKPEIVSAALGGWLKSL